jgi:putative spermidine/putrescine transport system ATP-binding protein
LTEVSIQALVKRYGDALAVDGLTLKAAEGQFVSLLGPSGCGKTTTLKCIAGFEEITSGRIAFDGHDISRLLPEERDIGMVFQSYALFPHMTVRGNLAFGLEMRRVPRAEMARRVDAALEMVQLTAFADRYPRALSGGQQQRVALARALVIEPRILLLDEPLANLDAKLRDEMRTFIRDLQQRVGITTLYVTHDQGEAMTMSDMVVVMFGGRIAQAAAPREVYDRPASEEVARFVGSANILPAEVDGTGALRFARDAATLRPLQPVGTEALLRVMVRPEQIGLTRADDPAAHVQGRVVARYFNGGHMDYRIASDAGEIAVRSSTAEDWGPGMTGVRRPPPGLLLLPAAAAVFFFIVLPYVNVLVMSFRAPSDATPYGDGYTLSNYAALAGDAYYLQPLFRTLWLGAITAVCCLLLGLPLALHIHAAGPRLRGFLYALVLSPLLVGIVVRTYGWTILLGNVGVINTLLRDFGLIERPIPLMYNSFGITVALTHVFLPFMVLPILSALQGIDPAVTAAARSLGARRGTVFRRITLPLALPGIRSGVVLVFVLAVSAYVTPALIGGMRIQTTTVMVVDILLDQYRWPFGSALSLTLALVAGLCVLAFGRLTRTRCT